MVSSIGWIESVWFLIDLDLWFCHHRFLKHRPDIGYCCFFAIIAFESVSRTLESCWFFQDVKDFNINVFKVEVD